MTVDEIDPAALEASEAEFMYRYLADAPASAARRLGIAVRRLGGGVVLSAREDGTRYWSKALGFTEPVTGDLVGEILDVYRAERNPHAVLQFAPDTLPPDWPEVRRRFGLRAGSRITKLAGPAAPVPEKEIDLKVGPVPPEDAEEWAGVILDAFGMPRAGLLDMVAAAVTSPAWRAFAVWDGDRVIAGGNLFVHGDVGSINTGATAATHRNRGAQAALVAVRAQAAVALGCRWLVSETGTPSLGQVNHSRNNMLKAGLTVRYIRQNWIWTEDQ